MEDEFDRCLGYSSFDGEVTEYNCDHEFPTDCEDCIYGPCDGKIDPRVDPDIEEEE
jgi:hypothetical protein